MSAVPGVMISSTFFDLRQIRADLRQFVEDQLGYRALLAEQPSFPVDPDIDTIENCRRRVEEDTDVLVLLIGRRYGSVDVETARSVTSIEYLTARPKGIPIYAFVEKSALTLFDVWEAGPGDALSRLVDDLKLFEFIKQVRSVDRVWTTGFETAEDVIRALRHQFAYLAGDGLALRRQMLTRDMSYLAGVSGRAFRLAVERPAAWEYQLFAQTLIQEIAACRDLRREHKLRLNLRAGSGLIPREEIFQWVQERIADWQQATSNIERLINEALPEALGPPGQPGDAGAIIFVAKRLGELYRRAIEWSQDLRRYQLPDECRAVDDKLALFADGVIAELEKFGPRILNQITDALTSAPPGKRRVVEMTLTITAPNTQPLLDEMERLRTLWADRGRG